MTTAVNDHGTKPTCASDREARATTSVDERGGSASVETAILTVAVGLLIALAIAGGRLVSAEAASGHAAQAAARIATLHRDPAAATTAAKAAARESLDAQRLHCTALAVVVDTRGFARPIGTPSTVTATVRCTVDWSDLGLPVAGGHVVESRFTSAIDQWRERT